MSYILIVFILSPFILLLPPLLFASSHQVLIPLSWLSVLFLLCGLLGLTKATPLGISENLTSGYIVESMTSPHLPSLAPLEGSH